MVGKQFVIPVMVALSAFVTLPSFAENPEKEMHHLIFSGILSHEDPRDWEKGLTQQIYKDESSGFLSPTQAQHFIDLVGQVRSEHQSYLNQNGAPTGNVLTDAERSLIKSQLNNVNAERQAQVRANSGRAYSADVCGQGVDPRGWEKALTSRIQKDLADGLLTPAQAELRLTQVGQVRNEHQNWLNENGAPNGNVLSAAERNEIKQQLSAVDNEREDDIIHNPNHPKTKFHF